MSSSPLAVAVVGAGAAGLCAARHLASNPQLRPTVIEQSRVIGGTWVYSPNIGDDEHGLPRHSSMYENLKTNLPKEVMAFPDFPFANQQKSFLHHSEVLEYLEQYAEAHLLHKYIQFSTQVEQVVPGKMGWDVTTKQLETGFTSTTSYQAVMVCNGHYSVPVVPKIHGLDKYEGNLIHSHNYRKPEQFDGQIVLILGGGASGTDIAVEVAGKASKVYLAHNNPPLGSRMPRNVEQVRGVVECGGGLKLVLKDGSEVEAEAVILATGYHYNFPFLAPECGVKVENRVVQPLYKHLISIANPTLAFVGLPVQICPFPQFDLQVRYFIKTLLGEAKLPSPAEMERDTQEEARYRREILGMPDKYFHKMGTLQRLSLCSLQWDYNRELARLGELKPLPEATENLYMAVHHRRQADLVDYKKDIWIMDADGSFSGNLVDNENNSAKHV